MSEFFSISSTLSVSEFKAQFSKETEEIIICVSYAWSKKDPTPRLHEGLYLTNIEFTIPWEVNSVSDIRHGKIFWFCKKKLLGYPYPPKFNCGDFYRVLVRKSSRKGNGENFYLEEVLEEITEPQFNDSIYDQIYEKYISLYSEDVKEILMYVEPDDSVKKATPLFCGVIKNPTASIITHGTNSSGEDTIIEGLLRIPSDHRNFSANSNVNLKAGNVYRAMVRKCLSDTYSGKSSFMLVSLEGIDNDENLTDIGDEFRSLAKTPVEDKDDPEFEITRKNGISISRGYISWSAPGFPNAETEVTLQCDPGDHMHATKARATLEKLLAQKESLDKSIYDLIVSERKEDGCNEIWIAHNGEGDGEHTISEEEFRNRLSYWLIDIDNCENVSVYVDMDCMYMEKLYRIDISPDGTLYSHGLEDLEAEG